MAKAARQKIKLESTAGTGYFYVTTKQTQSQEKIEVKKYDPKVRKHVLFVANRLRQEMAVSTVDAAPPTVQATKV